MALDTVLASSEAIDGTAARIPASLRSLKKRDAKPWGCTGRHVMGEPTEPIDGGTEAELMEVDPEAQRGNREALRDQFRDQVLEAFLARRGHDGPVPLAGLIGNDQPGLLPGASIANYLASAVVAGLRRAGVDVPAPLEVPGGEPGPQPPGASISRFLETEVVPGLRRAGLDVPAPLEVSAGEPGPQPPGASISRFLQSEVVSGLDALPPEMILEPELQPQGSPGSAIPQAPTPPSTQGPPPPPPEEMDVDVPVPPAQPLPAQAQPPPPTQPQAPPMVQAQQPPGGQPPPRTGSGRDADWATLTDEQKKERRRTGSRFGQAIATRTTQQRDQATQLAALEARFAQDRQTMRVTNSARKHFWGGSNPDQAFMRYLGIARGDRIDVDRYLKDRVRNAADSEFELSSYEQYEPGKYKAVLDIGSGFTIAAVLGNNDMQIRHAGPGSRQ
jgi:hypothetical protein